MRNWVEKAYYELAEPQFKALPEGIVKAIEKTRSYSFMDEELKEFTVEELIEATIIVHYYFLWGLEMNQHSRLYKFTACTSSYLMRRLRSEGHKFGPDTPSSVCYKISEGNST